MHMQKNIYKESKKVNMHQTEIFQSLSKDIRLRALLLLSKEKELCLCELEHALNSEQPKISRHMASMKKANLVTSRRAAQWVYYSINPKLAPWQTQIINGAIKGAQNDPQIKQDHQRLKTMKNRPVC